MSISWLEQMSVSLLNENLFVHVSLTRLGLQGSPHQSRSRSSPWRLIESLSSIKEKAHLAPPLSGSGEHGLEPYESFPIGRRFNSRSIVERNN